MIDVESLSFSYVSELTGSRVDALTGVDLSARPGSLTLVCGASGCGKSTLVKALTGLVPQMSPGEIGGTVRVSGRDLAEVPLTEVGHLCSAVFQNPRTQFFSETVSEELAFCGENYGRDPARLREDGQRAPTLMGITHLMGRKLATLSGGQLHKVARADLEPGRTRHCRRHRGARNPEEAGDDDRRRRTQAPLPARPGRPGPPRRGRGRDAPLERGRVLCDGRGNAELTRTARPRRPGATPGMAARGGPEGGNRVEGGAAPPRVRESELFLRGHPRL